MSRVGTDPRIGSELLGYRVDALIGRGGMGVVYRAYDLRLKRNVALKLIVPELSADERFRERFLAETEIAASLEHPNVVPIHDAGEVEGQRLGTSPTAIAVGENAVWLVDSDGGTVSRIDPNTNSVSRTGAAGARPETIAAGQGVVWIVGGSSLFGGGVGTLFRLDPETLAITVNVAMLAVPSLVGGGIVIGERDLWVTNAAGIERRGPSGETIAVIDLPLVADAPAAGLVLSGGALWTLENDGLARISTRRNNVVARIPLPRDPASGLTGIAGLAGGADAVWLTNAIRDTVIEVDARSNRVKRTIRVGHDPIGIAFAEGWLWVANHTDGTVSKIQPKTGKVVATIHVGPNPSEIAAGEGGVWVTVHP